MSFNTRPSTINEIAGFVDKRLTNAREQLRSTPPDHPNYDYIVERIAALEKNSGAIRSLVGKKLPSKKRDEWKDKLKKG